MYGTNERVWSGIELATSALAVRITYHETNPISIIRIII